MDQDQRIAFWQAIKDAGLECIGCPKEGDFRSTSERYLEAYELKECFGLLTDYDKEILPGVRRVIKELLKMAVWPHRDPVIVNRILEELWQGLHKASCVQPGLYWPLGEYGMLPFGKKESELEREEKTT